MPVTATRHCLVPVLSRSAKTSFPGRGPLRLVPWSFPPRGSNGLLGRSPPRQRRPRALTGCSPGSWGARPHGSHAARQHTETGQEAGRQQKQRVSTDLPREKTPRTLCGGPLPPLPRPGAPRTAAVAVAEPLPSLWAATVCCCRLLLACCQCGASCHGGSRVVCNVPLVARGAGWPGALGQPAVAAAPPSCLLLAREAPLEQAAAGLRWWRAGPGLRLWCAVAAAPRQPLLPLWATAPAPGRPCGVRCRAEQPLRAQGRVSGAWSAGARPRAGTQSGQLRHRHPHTSPDGKRRRGCLERRCGKGGCLAGPASEARRGARRCRSCWHTESGNGGNGSPQTLSVFLFFGGRSPETRCRRCRGRVRTVCWRSRRNRHHAREAQSARPVARQPAATPTASTAAFPASPAVEARQPERPCLFASRALRLRVPSPSASVPSAADAPGPPKHLGSLRGVRRYRRIASRLRFGAPTAWGRQGPDPGGGREVGQRYRASGRFRRSRTTLLARLVSQEYFSCPPTSSGPRHTWEYVQDQRKASEGPEAAVFSCGDALRGGWGIPWNPGWQGVGIYRRQVRGGDVDLQPRTILGSTIGHVSRAMLS